MGFFGETPVTLLLLISGCRTTLFSTLLGHYVTESPCHHVVMSPYHNVTKSHFWVTMSPSHTSGCHHVTISPCHHVGSFLILHLPQSDLNLISPAKIKIDLRTIFPSLTQSHNCYITIPVTMNTDTHRLSAKLSMFLTVGSYK